LFPYFTRISSRIVWMVLYLSPFSHCQGSTSRGQ
jgi:hypothetical protein